MGETKVDLQHLLEDLRDQYPFSIEEALVTEVAANALDSGSSFIHFRLDPSSRTFQVVDNGRGMNQEEFEEYHNIAASTKTKGTGIGFAGVGVKLALLYQSYVQTETRRGTFHTASIWHLDNRYHAPWELAQPPGLVKSESGTSLTLTVGEGSTLLNTSFVSDVLRTHFYPLLDPGFNPVVLGLYRQGVQFVLNGDVVKLATRAGASQERFFPLYLTRRTKGTQQDGIGVVRKWSSDLPEEQRGIAVSTYGKVIKRGWDWLDIPVRSRSRIEGTIEMPTLAEMLTTSKTDFMKYGPSGPKYYRFRKVAQDAISRILKDLGELSSSESAANQGLEPVTAEVQAIVSRILTEYPELNTLFDRAGRGTPTTGLFPNEQGTTKGVPAQGVDTMTGTRGGRGSGAGLDIASGTLPGMRIDPAENGPSTGNLYTGRRRPPAIFITYADDPNKDALGWLLGGTLWINRGHPAYRRAAGMGAVGYHIAVSASWALLEFVDPTKRPAFINKFLTGWGVHT